MIYLLYVYLLVCWVNRPVITPLIGVFVLAYTLMSGVAVVDMLVSTSTMLVWAGIVTVINIFSSKKFVLMFLSPMIWRKFKER